MDKKYYTLVVWESDACKWCPDFGAYSAPEVDAELTDRKWSGIPARHLKIVATKPNQSAILAAVARLNSLPAPRA